MFQSTFVRPARPMSVVLAALALVLAVSPRGAAAAPTYSLDIAPIVQSHCQECHRPGEAVPMTFMSYDEVRPWAKSIRKVVEAREMPPWGADPAIGHWKNDRRMSEDEVRTVSNWVAAGAPQGNPADLPEPLEWTQGWKIGKPDMIFEMAEDQILGDELVDEYRYVTIKTGLTEDRWIQAAESRPGNPDVVHHIIVFVASFGENRPRGEEALSSGLGGYAPGLPPVILPDGEGLFLPANSSLVLQMHYNKEPGVTATDRSSVGIKFATAPVQKRIRTVPVGNMGFVIPPGAPNHEVIAHKTIKEDITVRGIMPHMHLRGKDMLVSARFPDGSEKTLLSVPKYDFNWQLSYVFDEPLQAPAGTEFFATAHFDNSADNPDNPDPTAEVRWGLPTYAEMMFAFMSYTIDDEALNGIDPSIAAETIGGGE